MSCPAGPASRPGCFATTRSRTCCTPSGTETGTAATDAADADRVEQIRGLLDSGLTTEIIRRILPFLACGIHLPAQCLTAETAELLEREAERLGQRIDCLSRNRDAILAYLAAVRGAAGL